MRNERLEAFEDTLMAALQEIDRALEARYGDRLRRHPARPADGVTANPQYDGLFSIVPNFSAGIGSKYGPGYTLDLRIATLQPVDETLRATCEAEMIEALQAALPTLFPDRELHLDRDTHGWKLYGDLSLN